MLGRNTDARPERAQYLSLLQPLVTEELLAVGVLSRANALRDALLGQTSLAMSWELQSRSPSVGSELPASVMVGLTGSHLHCFAYGLRGREIVIDCEVAQLPRRGMRVEFETLRMTDRLDVSLADGRLVQFECMRGHDLNDDLIRLLLEIPGR